MPPPRPPPTACLSTVTSWRRRSEQALKRRTQTDLRCSDRQDPGREGQGRRRPRGEAAAWAMICARTVDGRFGDPGFPVPPHGHAVLLPGDWRPTSGVNDPGAWLRNVEPFFVRHPDRFLSRGPEPAHEPRLRARVRRGQADRQERQHGARRRSDRRGELLGDGQRRRHLDQVDPDAGRQAPVVAGRPRPLLRADLPQHRRHRDRDWRDKAKWSFWRPVTAINEGDGDGNPQTEAIRLEVADPDAALSRPRVWPLGRRRVDRGHRAGAVRHRPRHVQRDDHAAGASGSSSADRPITRNYDRLSDAVDEIVDARVWSGIHFRIADVQGAKIGRDVARWRRDHAFLRPLGHHHR